MSEFETKPEGPNEGHNRFYDKNVPADEVDGLEYAIRKTEETLKKAAGLSREVYEEHLASLKNQLEKAKERLRSEGQVS